MACGCDPKAYRLLQRPRSMQQGLMGARPAKQTQTLGVGALRLMGTGVEGGRKRMRRARHREGWGGRRMIWVCVARGGIPGQLKASETIRLPACCPTLSGECHTAAYTCESDARTDGPCRACTCAWPAVRLRGSRASAGRHGARTSREGGWRRPACHCAGSEKSCSMAAWPLACAYCSGVRPSCESTEGSALACSRPSTMPVWPYLHA